MEGIVLFNDALNTFYLRLHGVRQGFMMVPNELFIVPIVLHKCFNKYRSMCYPVFGMVLIKISLAANRNE